MNARSARIRIAVVGLGFGAAFAPIYQQHPDVESVGICDPDEARLAAVGESLQVPHELRFTRPDEVLSKVWDLPAITTSNALSWSLPHTSHRAIIAPSS